MEECLDRSLQDQLHAYELGLLADERRKKVQEHLLECGICFEKVSRLHEAIRLIRTDRDIRAVVESVVRDEVAIKSVWIKLKQLVWPKDTRAIFIKPLTIAILLLMLAYPVYRIGFYTNEKSVTQQVIKLYPVRTSSQTVISMEKGGQVAINFVFDGGQPGYSYEIRINSFKGEEIYTDYNYSGFNDSGRGCITIPIDRFSPGVYALRITDPGGEPLYNEQEYYFRVE